MISRALTVTEVNHFIKTTLEVSSVLKSLMIEGEISNLKFHSSGHVYFSLKDAQSNIRCVMFRSSVEKIRFRPKEGMHVIAKGAVSVYEKGGIYQVVVRSMEPQGIGALYQAYEQLKQELSERGWFAEQAKQPLPEDINRVGIVTSPTGAAIRDMISVITRRNPEIEILLFPTLVQGEAAAASIVKGIETFNKLENVDVIIIGRGGGSMEDLWAFNEEIVSAAIHQSLLPIISAVGHETDFTIADFTADFRAPTPSVAGEMVSEDLLAQLEIARQMEHRLVRGMRRILENNNACYQALVKRLNQKNPERTLTDMRLFLDEQQELLTRALQDKTRKNRSQIENLAGRLALLNPVNVLERGYAYIKDPDGGWIRSAAEGEKQKELIVHFKDGELKVKVAREVD